MKKHLHNSLRALFLSLAVLLSLPMLAVEVMIGGINYDLNAETTQATVKAKSSGEYSGSIVIPESVEHEGAAYSVTSIGEYAFWNCSVLTSVTIPNSVTWISQHAFDDCSGLTSVTIPNSVTGIDHYAFYKCSGLTSVTIPNSVTWIGTYAFSNCSGLTSVTIGNGVTSIGTYAFTKCPYLLDVYCYAEKVPSTDRGAFNSSCPEDATLHVPDASINSYRTTEPWSAFGTIAFINKEVMIDGIRYYLNAVSKKASVIAKSSGKYSDEVVIPESVEHEGTTYSVTSIGEKAFYECSGMTSVTIPNSVTSIGDYAFFYCSGLTSVTIPNSVTSIGSYAFWCCSGLISVTIGNSVTSIGQEAFRYCSGLTSVTIPNSVTSIGLGAFESCSGLTSVTIPNSVTSIGYGTFEDCSGLKSVTIPNSVTSIGEWAFYNCSGLTSVTIPNSVTSIGERAFWGCSKLDDVYCYAENVPDTESNAFDGSSIGTATLYVPAASVDSYNATAPWSSFSAIKALPQAMTIVDGELFENDEEQTLSTLTYTRTLPNLYWNALYVPFEIPVSEIIDKYEVAYVNNVNSYDHNDDGTIDDMRMEVIKIKSGTLNANYPYLIKARNEEAKNMTITLENTTLFQSVETTIDCSSVFAKHEITGIYNKRYKNELPEGAMAISMAGAWQPIVSGSYLNPFRLYMTITARDGSPVKVEPAAMSRIRISVLGEDVETDIEETRSETKNIILDLSGRSVLNPVKGGVYIVNGKKVIF